MMNMNLRFGFTSIKRNRNIGNAKIVRNMFRFNSAYSKPFSFTVRDKFDKFEKPAYIENEINNYKAYANQVNRKAEENRTNNALYQKFVIVNQKIKNSTEFLKTLDLEELISTEETKTTTSNINENFLIPIPELNVKLEYPSIFVENEQTRNLVDDINKLYSEINNQKANLNKNRISSYIEKLTSLITLLSQEHSKTTDKNSLLEEYSKILSFLKQNKSKNIPHNNDLIQLTLSHYFSLLNSIPELSVELVKSNQTLLYEALENYYYQRSPLKELLNINDFNNHLRRLIENCIVTLTKYTGDKSKDTGNFFSYLAYYFLKAKQYDKCEEYSLRSLEIFNSALENKKDVAIIQPYYFLSEVYINYHSDLKEAFLLLNEAFDIIKNTLNDIDIIYYEVFKFKIVNRLAWIYSLVEKEHIKKEIEVIEFYITNANWNILQSKYGHILNEALNLLSRQAELYENLELFRKSYEVYKQIYKLTQNTLSNSDRYSHTLNKLTALFKYSDDFNTNINYLTKENAAKFTSEYVDYLISLLTNCTKTKNFFAARQFIEIMESLIMKNPHILSQQTLANYYTISAFVKKNLNDYDSSASDLSKTLAFLYNSTSTKEKLIKYHFNLGYINILLNQSNKVIENFENCIKLIQSESHEEIMKDNLKLLFTLHFYLANVYLQLNEHIKATLQVTAVKEIISKFRSKLNEKEIIADYANYVQELQNEINK